LLTSHGAGDAVATPLSRASWGNRPRRRLRARLAGAVAVALTAAGIAATGASANTYTLRAVSPTVAGPQQWYPSFNSNGNNFVSTWDSSSKLTGQFQPQRSSFTVGEHVTWTWNSAWPNKIVRWAFDMSVSGLTGGDWNTLVEADGGMLWGEAPSQNHGWTHLDFSGLSKTWVDVKLMCGGPNPCYANTGELNLSNMVLWLEDNTPPQVDSATGTLANISALQGTVDLNVAAHDDTGVYRALIQSDGVTIATPNMDTHPTCQDATPGDGNPYDFAINRPCLDTASRTLTLDTTQLTEGTHSIRVLVEDEAGNVATAFGPVTRTIDNIPPPINTSPPIITGLFRHGQTLAADTGTWTGTGITFTRQWQRYDAGAWTNISGATNATYAVQPADYGKPLRVRSRATNSEGTTDTYSDATPAIASPTDPNGDLDGDSITNDSDPDIDGDGVPNNGDANPYDRSVTTPPGGSDSNGGGGPANAGSDSNGSGDTAGAGSGSGGGGGSRTETQNGQGPTATAAIAATFEGTRKRTITVKWGVKRKITGTLLGRDGQPIVGAKLDVTSTPQLMGAQASSLGQVATDAKGRFSYKLPAGVSRTIRFGYKRILEATTYAQTTEVVVQVIPKVTMKADRTSLRNKQAVSFTGKIAGAPAGVRKIVELQALDGHRWRTFASTRVANKGGTFRYRYRFTRTARSTVYQFRAIVRSEKGWPFTTGQTQSLKVKVRP
jgi:hypothetical protein